VRALLGRVPIRLHLIALVLGAWAVAYLFDLRGLDDSPVYLYTTALLLGVGLFSSTVGIDLAEAREHRRLILAAVTVGVLFKAVLIGGVLLLATRDPVFLVLGVAVAQIDPLSVAAILGDDRMSPRVKTILASWASFDDPVTVIMVVYASAIATNSFGLGEKTSQGAGIGSYGLDLLFNAALAAAAYACWRLLRGRPWLLGAALAILAAVAVWQFLMLALAIAGLFVRTPWLEAVVARVTTWALLLSGVLLGLLLVNGVSLGYGAALGAMAFVSQIVAGTILTRGLPRDDRIHLALAQQNGITAIILSLRLETQFNNAVAVIAPAILVTNLIHFAANWYADRRAPAPADPVRAVSPEP